MFSPIELSRRSSSDLRHDTKRILIDGEEGIEGRALMTLSALYLCASALRGHEIEVLYVDDPAVALGYTVLATDEALSINLFDLSNSAARWSDAHLYVSTRFREIHYEAAGCALDAGTFCLQAVQFPPLEYLIKPTSSIHVQAAHDPRTMAALIERKLSGGVNSNVG